MIGVELIGQIRRAFFEHRRAIKEISRDLRVSRTTVRKVVRSGRTTFKYAREVQPSPKLGEWIGPLTEIVESESKLPKRERRSTQRLFEELRGRGYDGAHDSVHRFVKEWREERARVPAQAFVPMSFAPGEAYQFDWSHETITLQGLPLMVKAAHMKLSHSRMPFVRTYFRETQELVFDAHDRAFAFYGGACRRGIYDNMKTAVEAIFIGKARQYNRRFLQMCSHHLIEPVACTPASGWEKGQVENQVGNLRDQLFRPKPRVSSLDELNGWLEDQCIAYAKRTKHPEFKDRTIWEVFEEERPSLMERRAPFDGFVEKAVRATTTCLITADHNRYSVDARAALDAAHASFESGVWASEDRRVRSGHLLPAGGGIGGEILQVPGIGHQRVARRAPFGGQHLQERLDMAVHSAALETLIRQGLFDRLRGRLRRERPQQPRAHRQDEHAHGHDDQENAAHPGSCDAAGRSWPVRLGLC